MNEKLLACRNVTMQFGGVTALNNVSLDFPANQVVGVIGPNGSGKSTLFNVLSAERRPTKGEVTWAGKRIDGLPPYRVASLGVVRTYQSASVFPDLTVQESMAFAHWTARKQKGKSIAEVADVTGLTEFQNVSCRSLPYGHQKILGVALGLLTQPSLLLLDEPAAGLNQGEVSRFLRLIRDIRATHDIGIGIIDHDMNLIMPACDRIAVLNFGNLIAIGTPAEIRGNQSVLDIYLSGDMRSDASH